MSGKTGTINKPRRKVSVIILLIAAVVMLLFLASGFAADLMWFSEVGYVSVFMKGITTELLLGIPVFILFTFLTEIYLRNIRKSYFEKIKSNQDTDAKRLNMITHGASVFAGGLIAYVAATELWNDFLQFMNATSFDIKEPVFGHDVSFYIFRLDFLKALEGVIISIATVYILLTFGYYCLLVFMRKPALFEDVVEDGPVDDGPEMRPPFSNTPLGKAFGDFTGKVSESIPNIKKTRRISKENSNEFFSVVLPQLTMLGILFFILLAFDFTLRQYELLQAHTGVVYGAGFTSVTVILWTYRLLALISLIGAVTIGFLLKKKMFKRLALIPLSMAVVAGLGILLGVLVQSYVVAPDELNKESKYLKRNIEFTQNAYQLKDVTVKDFSSENNLDAKAINDNSQTISNVRINDYEPVNTYYNQTQSIRQYYTFNDVDVDRYMVNGELTQTYLSVREIDESKISNTWLNRHLKYTHGYGVTLSRVDTVTASGQPDVLVKNIPPESSVDSIDIKEPRVYFGELTNDYSLVNTNEDEFDYPDGDKNKYNRYDGKAGIKMGFLERLVFAIRERSLKLLVSTNIKSDSKILINKNVVKRVKKLFPYIKYEQDPYCVTVGGKLYWIIDAYTTSSYYPYSEPYTGFVRGDNYIKNSIKVVVDAYDGTTDYFIVDEEDPIANTFRKIYPKLFKTKDKMPEGLYEHIRYPSNLFRIQAQIYTRYHMNNVKVFYQQEDMWDIAKELYDVEQIEMKPNYYIVKLPGEKNEEFINQIPFTPKSKNNMTALMIARNDGEHYGELLVYRFPKSKTTYGPMQVEAQIDQNTEISQDFSLWSQAGSTYSRGNIFVVPIEDSLLYIEPIYLEAANSAIPEVKRVIVMYNDKIAYEQTLGDCLKDLFGVSGGTVTTKTAKKDGGSGTVERDAGEGEAGKGGADSEGASKDPAKAAQEAYDNAQKALKNGDWAKYGEYMDELKEHLDELAD